MGCRILLPLYGPFAIHSYGLMVALAVYVFMFFLQRDPRFAMFNLNMHFPKIVLTGLISAIVGMRVLYGLQEWHTLHEWKDFIFLWQGGGSALGAVIGILIGVSFYLRYKALPTLRIFDYIALYAPLLHAISRIGCFLAGCCAGCQTTSWLCVTYSDLDSLAPLFVPLHPTQLYMFISFVLLFLLQYFYMQYVLIHSGQLLCFYLFCASFIRFIFDFIRCDRDMLFGLLSSNQVLALCIMLLAGFWLLVTSQIRHREHVT